MYYSVCLPIKTCMECPLKLQKQIEENFSKNPVIDKFIEIDFLQRSTTFPNTHYEFKYCHPI